MHPVAVERTIVRIDRDGVVRSRRRSPVRGCHLSLFDELVSLPTLAAHPALTFEVVLVRVEEHRLDAPRTRRRRKPWRIVDRVLVEVLERQTLSGAAGLATRCPPALADAFTTADVALGARHRPRARAADRLHAACGGRHRAVGQAWTRARVLPLPLRSRNASGVVSRSAGKGRQWPKPLDAKEDRP